MSALSMRPDWTLCGARRPNGLVIVAVFIAAVAVATIHRAEAEARQGIAMHGEPALAVDFKSLRYVNPNAPKGGRLVQGVVGTFDSVNPLIVKGLTLGKIRDLVIEGLLARNYDEPFTLYGLLAQTVETDADRSYVTFNLNPAARFSDGKPVTAEDVIFSWQLLRDKGRANYRTYYSKVSKAEKVGPLSVRFDLSGANDRELPLILGLMPVLPKHAINPNTFEETTFEPMIGSGPYVFGAIDPGRSMTFKRNPDYWGKNLPINRGLWNFDEIRYDYFRDGNVQFEAFRKGLFDFRVEVDPGRWVTAYDIPAVRDGRIVKENFATGLPKGPSGLVFNTRRPIFADVRVREALLLLFDFEWINRNLYFSRYQRTGSYFEGSELSSRGRPADARERALLAAFPGVVRPDVMAGTWAPPATDGSGRDRASLKRALGLLNAAGYSLVGTELRARSNGAPFAFEILCTTREQERLALAYSHQLERAGISASVRLVDAVQFEHRRINFDFDMMEYRWDQSLSPGNEQAFYWGSAAADQDGSRNYMGVKSAAIDALIAALLQARSREQFVSAVRALDRVLISGFYIVPLFHATDQWVARWTRVQHPTGTSLYGYLPETWWQQTPQR
jgi:peptide/nickel transport system substrate-binding protein